MESKTTQSGFTLVELITVIVILGFVSVMALPRMLQPDSFQARSVQDQLISAARTAQQLAMNKAVSANVQLTTDNANHRIRISYSENGVQTLDTTIPAAISITDTTATPLSFNKQGNLSAGSTVDISIGYPALHVRIEATGYTHAN